MAHGIKSPIKLVPKNWQSFRNNSVCNFLPGFLSFLSLEHPFLSPFDRANPKPDHPDTRTLLQTVLQNYPDRQRKSVLPETSF